MILPKRLWLSSTRFKEKTEILLKIQYFQSIFRGVIYMTNPAQQSLAID